jgi:hypothetical protein
MLQKVPLERQKEVAARLREGYTKKRTQEKVEEFNVKQMKQQNTNAIEQCQCIHTPANLAGRHTYLSFRRVTAIPEVCLELQARGFGADNVSTLGIKKLILLLKDHSKAYVQMEIFYPW